MDLLEHQAKMRLFAAHRVPVPAGEVAATSTCGSEIAARLGGATVIKAQVKVGGRGKAGRGSGWRPHRLRRPLTPRRSSAWRSRVIGYARCWSPRRSDIVTEYYLAFLIDRSAREIIAMFSESGGMDIEQVPGALRDIIRIAIDPGGRSTCSMPSPPGS